MTISYQPFRMYGCLDKNCLISALVRFFYFLLNLRFYFMSWGLGVGEGLLLVRRLRLECYHFSYTLPVLTIQHIRTPLPLFLHCPSRRLNISSSSYSMRLYIGRVCCRKKGSPHQVLHLIRPSIL